jgi:hypothetical protein
VARTAANKRFPIPAWLIRCRAITQADTETSASLRPNVRRTARVRPLSSTSSWAGHRRPVLERHPRADCADESTHARRRGQQCWSESEDTGGGQAERMYDLLGPSTLEYPYPLYDELRTARLLRSTVLRLHSGRYDNVVAVLPETQSATAAPLPLLVLFPLRLRLGRPADCPPRGRRLASGRALPSRRRRPSNRLVRGPVTTLPYSRTCGGSAGIALYSERI